MDSTSIIIGLDSSALLYGISEGEAGQAFLDALQQVRGTLVVPYYARIEVEDGWETVLDRKVATTEVLVERLAGLPSEIDQMFRGEVSSTESIDTALDIARELNVAARHLHENRVDLLAEAFQKRWSVVQEILDSCSLPSDPVEDLRNLNRQGERRFAEERPPGFRDARSKKKQPGLPGVGNLPYYPKFGDLYIWVQFCQYVGVSSVERALLITEDLKEDWWEGGWKKEKGTNTARQELIAELRQFSQITRFELLRCQDLVRLVQDKP